MCNTNIVLKDMEYIAGKFKNNSVFNNKKILITGAGGFLGFYFVQYFIHLINRGIRIKKLELLDNFMLGRPKWLQYAENIDKRIVLRKFDVSKDNIGDIKGAGSFDYIIHMASIASPVYYRKYPIQTVDANIWGLRKLLEYYKNKDIKGLLFFSSSEIYGDPIPKYVPTNEEYRGNVSCVGPRACYDESKRFGETLCYLYAKEFGMPISVVRPFNNYGPGMNINDKRVPADFANCLINNKDIVVLSDGGPKRTFCYIADAIIGYLKALTYGKYDYFNIGIASPELSIKELAYIYKQIGYELLNYKGNIVFKISKDKEYLTHNPARRCPDISKARKLLNYNPEIKLNDGIKRFILFLTETKRDK